jgi:hypothetical protein
MSVVWLMLSQASGALREQEDGLCLLRCVSGEEVLLNRITWEARLLAVNGRPWTLTWDEKGCAQLVGRHGDKVAAASLLRVHVQVAPSGALAVQREGLAAILLEDARQEHSVQYHRLDAPLVVGSRVLPFHAKLLFFTMPRQGCRLMWEMRRLQSFLLPDQAYHQSSAWIHNRWATLCKWVVGAGIPAEHMLRPLAGRHAKAGNLHGVSADFTCSTYALVVLLAWLAGNSKVDGQGSRAQALLARLVGYFIGEEVLEVCLSIDKSADQLPGLPATGRHPTHIVIQHGQVIMQPLLCSELLPKCLKKDLAAEVLEGKLPLGTLLATLAAKSALARTRPIATKLLLQCVHALATTADDIVQESPFTSDPARDGYQRRFYERHDAHRDEVEAVGIPDSAPGQESQLRKFSAGGLFGQSRVIGKYVLASRKAFHDSVHIRMAVDAARIGNTDALCGVIMGGASPDLECCWMAPQEVTK